MTFDTKYEEILPKMEMESLSNPYKKSILVHKIVCPEKRLEKEN